MISRYRSRISGPLLDRIDLHVEVPAVVYKEMSSDGAGESSGAVAARVVAARRIQVARAGSYSCNARTSASLLRRYCALDPAGCRMMEQAVDKLGLSARAHDRVLKVARTIADMAGAERIAVAHLAEAIQYRSLDRTMP